MTKMGFLKEDPRYQVDKEIRDCEQPNEINQSLTENAVQEVKMSLTKFVDPYTKFCNNVKGRSRQSQENQRL